MGFRLVSKSVTLNDLELGSFGVNYVKVVEDRPISLATIHRQLAVHVYETQNEDGF